MVFTFFVDFEFTVPLILNLLYMKILDWYTMHYIIVKDTTDVVLLDNQILYPFDFDFLVFSKTISRFV